MEMLEHPSLSVCDKPPMAVWKTPVDSMIQKLFLQMQAKVTKLWHYNGFGWTNRYNLV